MQEFLSLRGITLTRKKRNILQSLHWDIQHGEDWAILGRNGAGKTSLIRIILGLLWPSSGKIYAEGKQYGTFPLRNFLDKVSFLEAGQQDLALQKNLSVTDILATGVLNTIGLYTDTNQDQKQLIQQTIVENPWIADPKQPYTQLSSGEKRKLLLLRSLLNQPKLLLLDEPTASLDLTAKEGFFSLLTHYKEKYKFQVILITHQTDEILPFFTNLLLLKAGKVLRSGPISETLHANHLSELYDLPIHLEKWQDRFYSLTTR
ncbi:MAG: ATP-binding cassette domain-containing protein [Spirochaetota bacterium]